MSLIFRCSRCGKQVDLTKSQCPHCYAQFSNFEKAKKTADDDIIATVTLSCAVMAGAFGFIAGDWPIALFVVVGVFVISYFLNKKKKAL